MQQKVSKKSEWSSLRLSDIQENIQESLAEPNQRSITLWVVFQMMGSRPCLEKRNYKVTTPDYKLL